MARHRGARVRRQCGLNALIGFGAKTTRPPRPRVVWCARMMALIELGKARGYVTFGEIDEALPDGVDPRECITTLEDHGIDIVPHASLRLGGGDSPDEPTGCAPGCGFMPPAFPPRCENRFITSPVIRQAVCRMHRGGRALRPKLRMVR